MSSKGQVVIPENVRKRMGLSPGQQFVVVAEDDVIVLKSIEVPTMRDFDQMIKAPRKTAQDAGMRRSDVSKAIAKVRKK
jgi:AbrB family looped-hinge helix DNA binding protein